MKIAIMQPYFFPYIGYFQLIQATDKFVLGDNFQYISQGWVNRNRILNEGTKAFTYVRAPLQKHSHKTKIKDIRIVESIRWKQALLRQLEVYKKRAPYFQQVYSLIENCLETNESSLALFNAYCLKKTCDYLEIAFEITMQSTLEFDLREVVDRQKRVIRLCKSLGSNEYINSIGGTSLYDAENFAEQNIHLRFLKTDDILYRQNATDLSMPTLSIIDVMMFNSKEDIRSMLNSYTLI